MYKLNYNEYDKKIYETELKNFLPDKIIDLHTHIWKNTFTPQSTPNEGSKWPLMVADEMRAEQLLDSYKVLFPDKEVTPLCFGDVNYNIYENNAYVAQKAKEFGFPTLLRTDWTTTPEELEKYVSEYNCLGLKPYISNSPSYIPPSEIRIFDYLPYEHLEIANKHGWIIMLHIPRSKRLRDEVNLAQLMEIERKYPNIKLVVAHIGRAYSMEDIGDAFDVIKNTENMMFDFTANLSDDAIKACIETVGVKRLMFGSDLPIASMRMYRVTENGYYYNVVPRGLYGDVSDDPHMRESDEKDITLMIYEQIRSF